MHRSTSGSMFLAYYSEGTFALLSQLQLLNYILLLDAGLVKTVSQGGRCESD